MFERSPIRASAVGGQVAHVLSVSSTISQASEWTGLTPRAIRLYEQWGLVKPGRDRRAMRLYDMIALSRLQFIALARGVGVPVRALGELLAGDGSPSEASFTQLSVLCEQRIRQLQQEIGAVESTRKRCAESAREVA